MAVPGLSGPSGRIAGIIANSTAMTTSVAPARPGLIAPHGGSLVDLRVLSSARPSRRAWIT
jgi:hypothetical protein